ncbi:MAG: hypothetical protein HY925_08205 [Elusimicrobia bacterium]|nr:hypothetical protein [Elusimicrobiota bacterium]
MNSRAAAGLAAAALLGALPARADGFKTIAKELVKAAHEAGIKRLAVVPFEPADASNPQEGWSICERLTTQIVRQKTVKAIERSLLKQVMSEALLGRTGLVEPSALRKVGSILSVEAIVTGSFISAGDETIIAARLIDAQSGEILAAIEQTAKRDWHGPLELAGKFSAMPPDPWTFGGPDGETPLLPPPAPLSIGEIVSAAGLRDSIARKGCAEAAERVDNLEASILDLKTRYWASRLRDGLSLKTLRHNPGSTITDPELKRRFYLRMQEWYAGASVPPLDAAEVRRFTDVDQRAFQLHQECGL